MPSLARGFPSRGGCPRRRLRRLEKPGMREQPERILVNLLLFPFRLIRFLGDLVIVLWLLVVGGVILALLDAFLWLLLTRTPR